MDSRQGTEDELSKTEEKACRNESEWTADREIENELSKTVRRLKMSHLPLVLYYIKDHKKEKQVIALCRRLGIRTKKLQEQDLDKKVGVLAGIEPTMAQQANRSATPIMMDFPEYMILSGLAEEQLDQFLKEYRQQGIEPVALKAIVTLHNKDWTVRDLLMELMKERMSMMNFGGNKSENN